MASDDIWPAVHRLEAAAAKMAAAAAQTDEAVTRLAHMLEPGYGGNGLRLIEALEALEASDFKTPDA